MWSSGIMMLRCYCDMEQDFWAKSGQQDVTHLVSQLSFSYFILWKFGSKFYFFIKKISFPDFKKFKQNNSFSQLTVSTDRLSVRSTLIRFKFISSPQRKDGRSHWPPVVMVIQCNFACGMSLIPYKAGPGGGHSHTEEGTFRMKRWVSFPQLHKLRSQLWLVDDSFFDSCESKQLKCLKYII